MKRKELGQLGEGIALGYLQKKGYRLFEQNYRIRQGEIDLICLSPDQTLTFIEVKTRRNQLYGPAQNSITASKKKRLLKAAYHYLSLHPQYKESWRIDLITVKFTQAHKTLQHFTSILND